MNGGGNAPGGERPPLRKNQRGVALLLVLWLLVLLSVLALSFSGTARTQALIARNLIDNARARWLADGGVRLAVRRLWLAGDEEGPPVDGRAFRCRIGGAALSISIQNVHGLIDLNAGQPDVLAGLFTAAGADESAARHLADAVADFRDGDSRRRPDGAEADDYAAAGMAHGPKNNLFQAVEELQQVIGVSPELFGRLRGAVTVHSGRHRADLNLAPPLVRMAFGEPPEGPPALASRLPPMTENIFQFSVTVKTESGAWFVRDAILAVSGAPFPDYRVVRWGRPQERRETFTASPELPPC